MLLSALLSVSVALAAQAPAPVPPAASGSQALAPEVEALLDRVERAANDLRSLQADITLTKFDDINEETTFRLGRIALDGVGTGRRLAARFNKLVIETSPTSQETSELDDHYLYENGWLWETDSIHKSVKKRQVAPEGSSFDPLKLGEGDLPLPIGQTKRSVLESFEASSCPVPPVRTLAPLKDVEGLKLVPKPHSALAKDYTELQVFYGASGEIAVLHGVHLVQTNKDTITILLRNPKVNAEFGANDQALFATPDLDERRSAGWAVDVQRLPAKDVATVPPGSGDAPRPPDAAPR